MLLEDVDEGEAEGCEQGHDVANYMGRHSRGGRSLFFLDVVVVDAEGEAGCADGEGDVVELLVADLEEEDGHDDGARDGEVLEHHDGGDGGEGVGVH